MVFEAGHLRGGTFDPIHRGHLDVARAAHDALGLERILLMPADDQAAIDASSEAEIERRVAAMNRGEMTFHPWEEVRKDLGLK